MVLRGHKKNLTQRYQVRLVEFLFIEAERIFFQLTNEFSSTKKEQILWKIEHFMKNV